MPNCENCNRCPLGERLLRPTRQVVDIENDWIVIRNGRADYHIEADRCRTHKELVNWIRQISGKTWCTVAMVRGLIDAAKTINKWGD